MTGRINYTPEATKQLHDLDDWIAHVAAPRVAQEFVTAVMDHIDGILLFPTSGRGRDDVRPGIRTTTYNKRTLVAYEIDESGAALIVNVLGVFHGGQDWETTLRADQSSAAEGWYS